MPGSGGMVLDPSGYQMCRFDSNDVSFRHRTMECWTPFLGKASAATRYPTTPLLGRLLPRRVEPNPRGLQETTQFGLAEPLDRSPGGNNVGRWRGCVTRLSKGEAHEGSSPPTLSTAQGSAGHPYDPAISLVLERALDLTRWLLSRTTIGGLDGKELPHRYRFPAGVRLAFRHPHPSTFGRQVYGAARRRVRFLTDFRHVGGAYSVAQRLRDTPSSPQRGG